MGNFNQGNNRRGESPTSGSGDLSNLRRFRDPAMRFGGFAAALVSAERRQSLRASQIEGRNLDDLSSGVDPEATRAAINAYPNRFGDLLFKNPVLVRMFITGMPDMDRHAANEWKSDGVFQTTEADYLLRLAISARIRSGEQGMKDWVPLPQATLLGVTEAINKDPSRFAMLLRVNQVLGAVLAEGMGITTRDTNNS